MELCSEQYKKWSIVVKILNYKMLDKREVLIVLVVLAFTASANRQARSPDKMEVNIPNYSYERESGEHQENIKEEAAYWQGQGDKLPEREEEGHQQLDKDREKNQETYEHEKEHSIDQQQSLNKEMNETYQSDRDKAESHHESNQEHYMQYHDNANYETPSTNKTAEDIPQSETADRYGEKGTEYAENGHDKIENHDVNGDSPSISYSKN